MRLILLTHNKVALIDDEDWENLRHSNWIYIKGGYAGRTKPKNKGVILMHREITNCPLHLFVDHINGNRLDNRKNNLRICTRTGNSRNRKRQRNNTSGYIGVYWHSRGYWTAYGHRNGKPVHIGHFKNKVEAARARDKWVKEHYGEYAKLNFA